jgi:serine/threonine protein kinase
MQPTSLLWTNYRLTDKVIGRGSNATVYLGFSQHVPTKKVAFKVIDKRGLTEEKLKEVKQEMDILLSLQNLPGVIQLYETFEDSNCVYFILEHKSCDLFTFIRQNAPLPEPTVRGIFQQLLDAVALCHSKNVCHRDLKIENVLIDETTLEIALCDFGFATFFELDKPLTKWCGSPHTVAPEIILRRPYNPVATDVWALGSILYTLLCGSFPFQAKNFKEMFHRTTVGMIHPFPQPVSQAARDLVTRILKTRPDKRPDIADVKLHAFLLAEPVP